MLAEQVCVDIEQEAGEQSQKSSPDGTEHGHLFTDILI